MINSTSSEEEVAREAREQCPDDPSAMTGAQWRDENGATHEEALGRLLPEVRRMMDEEGMWMVSCPRAPAGAEVPVCSMQGKLYSIIIDRELDPELFYHGIQVAGPLRAPVIHKENDINQPS